MITARTSHLRGVAMAGMLGILLWGGHSRADAPPGRYTVATEGTIDGGTVLDTKTGLTWQRQSPVALQTWAAATASCQALGAGWRLPSVKELMTLLDFSKIFTDTLIDSTAFPSAAPGNYWSSVPYPDFPSLVAAVAFDSGLAVYGGATQTSHVRCVR